MGKEMAQTKKGAQKTRDTNIKKHGADFYAKAGAIGGSRKVPKGFAMMDKEKVRAAGAKGGSISRRGRAAL